MGASVMLYLRSATPTATVAELRPIGPRGEIRSVTHTMFGCTTCPISMPSECGFGMLYRLIWMVSSFSVIVSPTSGRRRARLLGERIRRDLVRRIRDLLEIGLVRRRDDHGRTFRHIGAHAAGVVHVMMGEHQVGDPLARILLLHRVDDPARLPLADRRIEDHDAILHGDDQIVGGAADDVLHVRRKFDQLEAAAGHEIHLVRVEEAAEEQTPDDPLIGHVGCCRDVRDGPKLLRHLERRGRIDGFAATSYRSAAGSRGRRAGTTANAQAGRRYGLPVTENEVVVVIAVDVIVVAGPHRDR